MLRNIQRYSGVFISNPRGALKLIFQVFKATIIETISYKFSLKTARISQGSRELTLLVLHPFILLIYALDKRKILSKQKLLNQIDFTIPSFLSEFNGKELNGLIGRFDKYGKLVKIDEFNKNFIPRSRSDIQLRKVAGKIFIRKIYLGNLRWFRMFNEIRALMLLNKKKILAPILLNFSFSKKYIDFTYSGKSLHNLLIEKGADLNIEERYFKDGLSYFQEHFDEFKEIIANKLIEIHRAGIMLYDINYANITITENSKQAVFIDFESSRIFANQSSSKFLIQRDRDTHKLNILLGTNNFNYDIVKTKLSEIISGNTIYAPYSIGHGLNTRHLFDRNVGFGKFFYSIINEVKHTRAETILSLGSNNSSVELLIARKIRCKIVTVEFNKEFFSQAQFFLKASEWAENKDLQVELLNEDMGEISQLKNEYDLILGLCSLYYLGSDKMINVLRHLKTNSKFLLLQANNAIGIGRSTKEDYETASLDWQILILKSLNYIIIRVNKWKNYSRPTILAQCKVD